jgi:hypothetical protein
MTYLHPAVFLTILWGVFSSFGNEEKDSHPPFRRPLSHLSEGNNQARPPSPPPPLHSFFEGRQLSAEDQELLQEFMNLSRAGHNPLPNPREE